MADWDDDDFEVPVLPAAVTSIKPPAFDDDEEEEDLALKEEVKSVITKPSATVLAAQKKKAEDEERALEAKAKLAAYENETPEQRKLREKLQAEQADAEIAGELFSGGKGGMAAEGTDSITKGLGSMTLKTKDDHTKYGNVTRQKLSGSSGFNVVAFYKTLSKVLDQPAVTGEMVDDIIKDLTAIRDSKAKAAKTVVAKKSKKEIEKEEKAHADKFGGSFKASKYDHLNDMEDDFM